MTNNFVLLKTFFSGLQNRIFRYIGEDINNYFIYILPHHLTYGSVYDNSLAHLKKLLFEFPQTIAFLLSYIHFFNFTSLLSSYMLLQANQVRYDMPHSMIMVHLSVHTVEIFSEFLLSIPVLLLHLLYTPYQESIDFLFL